jgi:hypothetical protein
VQRAVILDVLDGEIAAVLQILARKYQALHLCTVNGDALLVQNYGLDGADGAAD